MAQDLKQQTIRGLRWDGIGKFANFIIGFIIGIVMARLLSPKDYGTLAMITVFLAISETFSNCGLGNALIRKPDMSESDLSTAFIFQTGMAFVCYIILFFISPYVALFYNNPILKDVLRLEAINVILESLKYIQFSLCKRKIDFKTTTRISTSSGLLSGTFGIIMAYLGYGVWALVGWHILNNLLITGQYWLYSSWRPSFHFSKVSFRYLWNYGSKMLMSGLVGNIVSNISSVLIGKFFSPTSLGYYTKAGSLAKMPTSNLGSIISMVSFPVLSKIQNDDERMMQNYRRIIKLTAYMIFPVMIVLTCLAHPLVIVLFTEKWENCIVYFQLICIAQLLGPIQGINVNLLQVKGRPDLFLRITLLKNVLSVLIIFSAIPFGIVGVCFGSIFSSILFFIINTYYTGKLIHVGLIRQIVDVLPFLLNSIVAGAFAYFCNYLSSNDYINLAVGGILGFGYYLGVSVLLKSEQLFDLIAIIKNK